MQFVVGNIVEGKVTGITKFGAFVDIGEGKTGMVHISEVAPTYVKEISEHLTDGQLVKTKILNISDDGKISLSIKQAMPAEKASPSPQQNRNRGDRPNKFDRDNNSNRPYQKKEFNNNRKPQRAASNSAPTFEDMLNKFKQSSDDKMSDLKKFSENKRSRRGTGSKSSK